MGDNRAKNDGRETRIRLNIWLLPLFVGMFAIIYGLTGYRGWLVFFIGTAGAWLLAWLWVRALQRSLRIDRKLHLAWATVGDSVHEQLKLINNSWLPAIWVEIVDTSDTSATPIRLLSDVAPHASRTRHPSHLCRRRGLYRLGPTRLRSGDPFGIYTLTVHDHHSSTILVTPPVLPLTRLKIAPGGWAGDQRRRRGGLERDISDAGVRNYVPGDSLRRIHWPATARFDALFVRQLEVAASGDWWIFVDLDAGVQAGNAQDSTLELSIVLAASLARRGLKERRREGLALVGPRLVWLEPRAGPAQNWRILQALSMAEEGDRSMADLMAIGRPTRTATLILITPTTDPAFVGAAVKRRRAGNMVVLLVDPTEFGGPVDQSKVAGALAYSGIPFARMPRTLLIEAYSSTDRAAWPRSGEQETGKRFLKQGLASWQSME